jgi:hypothetical protein
MSPDLAVKVQLLLRAPAFREDLEKTAALLGLNDSQKAEAVLRAADAISLDRIEKQAKIPGLSRNPGPQARDKAWSWLVGGLLGGGGAGLTAGEIHGSHAAEAARQAGLTQGLASPAHAGDLAKHDLAGLGIGGLGGGILGALAGSGMSDGDTWGTGLGAGLGAVGGAGLGAYIQDMMRNQATA